MTELFPIKKAAWLAHSQEEDWPETKSNESCPENHILWNKKKKKIYRDPYKSIKAFYWLTWSAPRNPYGPLTMDIFRPVLGVPEYRAEQK